MKHEILIMLTMLLPDYAEKIVSGLVLKGYQVGPASSSKNILSDSKGGVSHVLGLLVTIFDTNDTYEASRDRVIASLKEVLRDAKAKYYSYIVISGDWYGSWVVSNIKIKNDVPKPPSPKKPSRTEIPHLKLVPSE